jgi:glycosyltransferase involved in cell wall biosynthesis
MTAIVVGVYLAMLAALAVVGGHRLRLAVVAAFARPTLAPPLAMYPRVTVQVPLFDERNVAARVIAAVGALDWPRDRLEIQVLDDSTDDTTAIAAAAVDRLVANGVDAVLLHRTRRAGFKAGALAAGLEVAKGEVLAVFDADFTPAPDFLLRVVPHLCADASIGMVQARWGHRAPRRPASAWLARAQALMLDGHFSVEHTARQGLGRWFNFNGTAGIWRRSAILAAGGWSSDTLTEDLDLSYRAQLAGWRFVYVDDVVVVADLPADVTAFRAQQRRWARGAVQTLRKLIGPVWRSDATLGTKLEATAHLAGNLAYPLSLLVAALLPVMVYLRAAPGWRVFAWVDLALFAVAVGSAIAFYGVAIRRTGGGWRRAVVDVPVALALGAGLALSQSRAVLEGLVDGGVFVRTPKGHGYAVKSDLVAVGEAVLAAWSWVGVVIAVATVQPASVPFLTLVAAGYTALAASVITMGTQVRGHSHQGSRQAPSASIVDSTA